MCDVWVLGCLGVKGSEGGKEKKRGRWPLFILVADFVESTTLSSQKLLHLVIAPVWSISILTKVLHSASFHPPSVFCQSFNLSYLL